MTITAAPPAAEPRSDQSRRKPKPRWAFGKGAMIGLVTSAPLFGLTTWLLAQVGIGNHGASMVDCLRMASVFSSVAAFLTAGGIGRLAAQASLEKSGGRRRAVVVASRTMAVAGASLVVLAAIPLGNLPTRWWGWLGLFAGGGIAGSIIGMLIGVICHHPKVSLAPGRPPAP